MAEQRCQENSTYLVVWKCGRKKGEQKVEAQGAPRAVAKVRIAVASELGERESDVRITAVSVLS